LSAFWHDEQDEERLLELLQHKARKLKARTSLVAWCRAAGFEPAQHHRLILDLLADVASGSEDRVMIFMPPGSAKSTYGSILFPPWYLCQFPTHNVMACSHTQTLAERFGRRVRNLIQAHPDELGLEVQHDNAAVGRWQLAPAENAEHEGEGGEYLAAGVGMGIAGFRSDLTLIDDPVKSREDAESQIQRDKVWDWWLFDVRPRLKPGGRVVLIMTRWHEDDLAGRLLKDEPGRWKVLRLPMEADEEEDALGRRLGERLWPEWFTDDMVREAKSDPYLWISLYQQRPTAAEGTYWKRHWLHRVPAHHVPPRQALRIYGGSDYATKEGEGDYTVHAVVGLDPQDRPWLLDLWRKQTTSDWWVSSWCDLVCKWKPHGWAEEQGQILRGVGPWLEREQRKRKAFTNRQQFTSRGDKATMARSMQGLVATMGLWYSQEEPWVGDLEAELLSFPGGKNDDIHDAIGKAGMLLDIAVRGVEDKPPPPAKVSGYKTMRPAGGASMKVL
jgi:phage terminase large subunit-like protein